MSSLCSGIFEGGFMKAVIIDYEICNMFSVKHACENVGFAASISSSPKEINDADIVILPGVGAFGDAMNSLRRLKLIQPIKEAIASGKPFIGICLGLQLLMEESEEFGNHKGLGIIPGAVKRFKKTFDPQTQKRLKIPHMGWNRIMAPGKHLDNLWTGTPLNDISPREFFYFVHSYFVEPENKDHILAMTEYGNHVFCSAIRWKNVYAFQFHPERSGLMGIRIYQNLKSLIQRSNVETFGKQRSFYG